MKKEIDALRINNNELALREEEYRDAVKKLHDTTQDLEEKFNKKIHENRIQVEETRKQNKKYDDKIKELTAAHGNERTKRAEEVKKLKDRIKNMIEEAQVEKEDNLISEDEVNERAKEMAEKMAKEINVKVTLEREEFENQINALKQDLISAKMIIDQNAEEYEKQKAELKNQISVGTKTNDLVNKGIFGTYI